MNRLFYTIIGLCVIIAFIFPPAPTRAQNEVPRFEFADCPFPVPPGEGVECGYLIVPEDRTDPASRTIRLAVAILRSKSDHPAPDPVIYLEGGPGGYPLAFPELWYDSPIRDSRDLILLDQRGTGYSEPPMDCPEIDQLVLDTLDDQLGDEEELKQNTITALKCRDRLAAEGVNLAAYNSIENAADVADLRIVLGIETWNLYGISYGTRLALTIMRDHPAGVRSVVLDSVYPPEVEAYADLLPDGLRAFQALFDGCAADTECSTAYPQLEQVFYDLLPQLNADPPLVTVEHPFREGTYDFLLTGDALIEAMFGALYATEVIPYLPALLYQVHNGDPDLMVNLAMLLAVQGDFIAEGMYYSVECNEEIPFNPSGDVLESLQDYPEFTSFIVNGVGYEICAGWGAGTAAAIENEPVQSDIPTLILSGEYDPITPPAWGQITADNLSQSYFYEFPGMGHGVSVSGTCPQGIMMDFIADPSTAPDTACREKMKPPDFMVW